jgi:hypothetical protein
MGRDPGLVRYLVFANPGSCILLYPRRRRWAFRCSVARVASSSCRRCDRTGHGAANARIRGLRSSADARGDCCHHANSTARARVRSPLLGVVGRRGRARRWFAGHVTTRVRASGRRARARPLLPRRSDALAQRPVARDRDARSRRLLERRADPAASRSRAERWC